MCHAVPILGPGRPKAWAEGVGGCEKNAPIYTAQIYPHEVSGSEPCAIARTLGARMQCGSGLSHCCYVETVAFFLARVSKIATSRTCCNVGVLPYKLWCCCVVCARHCGFMILCVCVCSGFGCRDSFSCTAGILKNFPKVHCNAPCTDICCDLIPNSTCLTRPLGVLERILYAPAACRIAAQKAKRLGWGFCGVVFLAGVVVLLEVVFFFSLAVWPLSFSILVLTSKELPPDFQPHTRTVNVS